jgi:hypothetical protein
MSATLRLRRGRLFIGRADHERHFAGLECVVLLRDGDALLVLPVRHPAAGGYLLKIRNAAGDRVVDAADFFRAHGLEDGDGGDDGDDRTLPAVWDEARAALVCASAFTR